MSEKLQEQCESIKETVLAEYRKGNIVFMGVEGLMVAPLDKFLEQPVEGILYDLNRDEAVTLTLINDPKWVNDYAVAKVIRELVIQKNILQKKIDEVNK